MNRAIFLSIACMLWVFSVKGQYIENASDLSQASTGGSARVRGIGGAFVSLGGDISSAGVNPAGLGFYNRSVISLSPSLKIGNGENTYLGNQNRDYNSFFNLDNMGIVFNNTKDDIEKGSFRGGSFAITYNRTKDLNRKINYSGTNTNNDILGWFIEQANIELREDGDLQSKFTNAAYDAYLLELFEESDEQGTYEVYDTYIYPTTEDDPTIQSESRTENGSVSEVNFSYGGNFDDRVYFGAGLGINSFSKVINSTYTEKPSDPAIDKYDVTNQRNTQGVGVNLKLGAIFRPQDFITVGVNYTTPTVYNLTENTEFYIDAYWNNFQYDSTTTLNYQESAIYENTFNYQIYNPGKLSGGITIFINESGFITGDVSYTNPANTYFDSDEGSFDSENDRLKGLFNSMTSLRLGGEYRLGIFRFRGGVQQKTFFDQNLDKQERYIFSGGAGIHLPDYFFDLAVNYNQNEYQIRPYSMPAGEQRLVNGEISNVYTTFTMGFNF